ncbi:MAG: hypothetical protein MT490_15370 [Sphingomonas sp.]|uniref:hypothetical protein n=1 Tax=Sphingomonas sp. TaxID=28214 RepID=UPI0022728CA0|nr:hypothetical protein [Sphingomonas sp.]MCX8477167.1 hypothetical protein [Sphingomonas sp.]
MRTNVILLALAPLLASPSAEAQRMLWDRVGSVEVRVGSTRETIWVPGRQRYREVRLCVARRALRINSFTIDFPMRQGRWPHEQSVPLNRTVSPGQCTRATWIRGGPRDIRRVELRLARSNAGPRATVRLEAR